MGKDYYNVLDVAKGATQDEIKKAFRKKAHEFHPDKAHGDEAKFKEVNEAYQVLSNEQKRQQYDQFGQTFDGAGAQYANMNWGDFMNNFGDIFSGFGQAAGQSRGGGTRVDFGNLGDVFGDIFGGRGNSRQSGRGSDLEYTMTIDFREAVFGVEKTLEIDPLSQCSRCKGNGAEPGTRIIDCPQCQGRGQVQQTQNTVLGAFSTVSVCPTCQGEGKKPEKFCKQCHGQGRSKELKKILVKVPAGIDNGQTIRLSGQGEAGMKGGTSGDLYIHFNVQPDSSFHRSGIDIRSQVEISFSQAALGDKIRVETLDGKVDLKVPAGTQTSKLFKLSGKGVPVLGGAGRGDQLVEVIVKTPTKLSRKQKIILEELDA
jgi:molecular chaperone DnaJ